MFLLILSEAVLVTPSIVAVIVTVLDNETPEPTSRAVTVPSLVITAAVVSELLHSTLPV
jgi:hypothetical protein